MQLVQQQNAWLYSVLQPSGEGPKELLVEAESSMRQPLQRCLSKRALCRRDCRPLEREDRDSRFPNALQINPSRLFVMTSTRSMLPVIGIGILLVLNQGVGPVRSLGGRFTLYEVKSDVAVLCALRCCRSRSFRNTKSTGLATTMSGTSIPQLRPDIILNKAEGRIAQSVFAIEFRTGRRATGARALQRSPKAGNQGSASHI